MIFAEVPLRFYGVIACLDSRFRVFDSGAKVAYFLLQFLHKKCFLDPICRGFNSHYLIMCESKVQVFVPWEVSGF